MYQQVWLTYLVHVSDDLIFDFRTSGINVEVERFNFLFYNSDLHNLFFFLDLLVLIQDAY